MYEKIALIAAIVLPLWNIPLIVKIIKRKSSRDISLAWALGVWICFVIMAPDALTSDDLVWRAFNMVNLVLFTGVMIAVISFRRGR